MTNKIKTYQVEVAPPQSEPQTYTIAAASVLDAKAEASKLYYGSVFTGQFKFIKATVVKEKSDPVLCRRCGKHPKREGFHLCASCVDEVFPAQPVPPAIKRVLKQINKSK